MSVARFTRRLVPAIGLISLLAPRPAFARDPARAAVLFSEGRAAMAAHDYDLARKKFLESESAEPRVGTLINLAQCEEELTKLASSRQFWQQALDLARAEHDARATFIDQELARIDARVPRLSIRLVPTAPLDTIVRRDGADFASASFGVALPVETGVHTLTVRAEGYAARQYTLEIGEAERREVLVEPGDRRPTPPPALPVEPPSPALPTVRPNAPGPLRTWSYLASGAGVVALGVGAGYGILAMNASSNASAHCNGDLCDAAGATARNDEIDKAQIATIGFAAGGALVVTGAVLRMMSPSPGEEHLVRRNTAYVLGGAGLAAAMVGAVFGTRAIVEHRDASAGCAAGPCDPQGLAAQRDEGPDTTIAVVSFAGSAALITAAGALLWWPAAGGARTTMASCTLAPLATTGGGGLLAGGRW